MNEIEPLLLNIYETFEFVGVFLMAIVGGQMARQKEYDLFGFLVISMVASLGGGILRDAMILSGPVAAVDRPVYLLIASCGALVAFLTKLKGRVWELFHVHADALVLGIWAVVGATKALVFNLSPSSAVFMGLLTAIGGGIMADILVGNVPKVLLGRRLYAAPAFISAVIVVILTEMGFDAWGMLLAPIPATGLAVLSYWRHWHIPFHAGFAPVNDIAKEIRDAAEPLESSGREIAREVEPQPLRRMRHQAMEKADAEMAKAEEGLDDPDDVPERNEHTR